MIRKGDWLQTFTNRRFWPLDPRPEDVCAVDIAHALSNICRFGGHCSPFYSVAQHSFLVSVSCGDDYTAKWGLMHDAAEAYVGDMVRPLKRYCPEFRRIESTVLEAIRIRYDLSKDIPSAVTAIDEAILQNEAQAVMGVNADWTFGWPALGMTVEPWDRGRTFHAFLERFRYLFPGESLA